MHVLRYWKRQPKTTAKKEIWFSNVLVTKEEFEAFAKKQELALFGDNTSDNLIHARRQHCWGMLYYAFGMTPENTKLNHH